MRIDTVHERPVPHASVGHRRIHLTAPGGGYQAMGAPQPRDQNRVARRSARELVRRRRDEVASGAAFLTRLTTTSNNQGGVRDGA